VEVKKMTTRDLFFIAVATIILATIGIVAYEAIKM